MVARPRGARASPQETAERPPPRPPPSVIRAPLYPNPSPPPPLFFLVSPSPLSPLSPGKRCFVGNLAWRTSWQDLKDKFREAGTVVYANVQRDDANRSKGWGIVEFGSPEEALAAIAALNGAELDGRKLLVREDREDRDVKAHHAGGAEGERRERPPRRDGPRPPRADRGPPRDPRPEASSGLQVVVQGLPWAYTGDDLRALLAEFGEVSRADVVMGRDGRSRGYGTVRFADGAGAAAAIAGKHGADLEGRTLTVKMDRFA